MKIIGSLLSGVKKAAQFAFKTPTRAALTAGTAGFALGRDSSYAMGHPAMGYMGRY